MVVPKKLKSLTLSLWDGRLFLVLIQCLRRCVAENKITYLVLLAFKDSLCAANHSPTLSSSLFMLLLTIISLSLTSVLF